MTAIPDAKTDGPQSIEGRFVGGRFVCSRTFRVGNG